MAAQRRIDLVLDSVKRLLRIGATANLLNLLQKQHPADLGQIFSELPDKDREAAFSLLMRLPRRLEAERESENEALSTYLDDPIKFFVPARFLFGTLLVRREVRPDSISRAHDASFPSSASRICC